MRPATSTQKLRQHSLWPLLLAALCLVALLDVSLAPWVLVPALAVLMLGLGLWRTLLVATLLLVFSTASRWSEVAQLGANLRFAAFAALIMVTWIGGDDRKMGPPPSMSRALRSLFGGLYFLSFAALVSTPWSAARFTSLTQAIALLGFVLFLHGLVRRRWRDPEVILGDLRALYLSLIAVSLLNLFNLLQNDPSSFGVGSRFQGVFANPNQLAMSQTLVFGMGLALFVLTRNYLLLAASVIPAWLILLSESRTGLLAMLFGIGLALALKYRGQAARWLPVVLLLPLAALMLAYWLRFGLVQAETAEWILRGGEADDLLSGRTDIWAAVVEMIRARPIEGHGFGATPALLSNYIDPDGQVASTSSVHNGLLQVALETGFLGFVGLFVALYGTFLIVMNASKEPGYWGFVSFAGMGLAIQFSESSLVWTAQYFPYVFWTMVIALELLAAGRCLPVSRDHVEMRRMRNG